MLTFQYYFGFPIENAREFFKYQLKSHAQPGCIARVVAILRISCIAEKENLSRVWYQSIKLKTGFFTLI